MKRWLIALALLTGCSAGMTFKASECFVRATGETRQREVKTSCALRSGGSINDHAKPCVMWNNKTIAERKHTIVCQRSEWREEE